MAHAQERSRERRRLSITIPVDLHDQLVEAADEDLCSTAAVVRRAIQIHLRRRDEALAASASASASAEAVRAARAATQVNESVRLS